MKKCTGEMVKQIIRPVNYSVNSQDLYNMESLGEWAKILRDSEDLVQVGACIFQDSSKPTGVLCTTKIYTSLSFGFIYLTSVHGVLTVQCGSACKQSGKQQETSFVYSTDLFVVDEIEKSETNCLLQETGETVYFKWRMGYNRIQWHR